MSDIIEDFERDQQRRYDGVIHEKLLEIQEKKKQGKKLSKGEIKLVWFFGDKSLLSKEEKQFIHSFKHSREEDYR